jgi:hypothetical protein
MFIPYWGLVTIAVVFVWLISLNAQQEHEHRDKLERLDRIEKGSMFLDDGDSY